MIAKTLLLKHLWKQSRKSKKISYYRREMFPTHFIKCGLIPIMVLWISAQVDIYSGIPFVDHYGVTDYKAGPINRDISQDSNGILYFANSQGLLKYDGTAWELFKVGPF